MALSLIPATHAYGGGTANWQIAVAQTGVAPGSGSFGLWGWCELSGSTTPSNPTSGNSGSCQAAIYGYGHGGGGPVQECSFSESVSSWGEAPGLGLTLSPAIPNDLWLFAGTITLSPTQGCAAIGSTLTAVFDIGPAQSGHYNFDFLFALFGIPVGEFQVQIAQTTH
jgi:hypothetical protein